VLRYHSSERKVAPYLNCTICKLVPSVCCGKGQISSVASLTGINVFNKPRENPGCLVTTHALFRYYHRITALTLEEDALSIHPCDGNLVELEKLSKAPTMISITIECRDVKTNWSTRSLTNLNIMLILAARASQAAIVELLLAFHGSTWIG
jgi:hypothetical protein